MTITLKRSTTINDHGHQHDQDVNSVALELLGDVDVGLLDQWLGELMQSTTPSTGQRRPCGPRLC